MTDTLEFKGFGKIPRLRRRIVIPEKIDGTNGAVGVLTEREPGFSDPRVQHVHPDGLALGVYAQSRKNIITPERDNHGFARWVHGNAEALAVILGPGIHFGEWWGSGIQRGYGLEKDDKRFSLFNTKRWAELIQAVKAQVSGLEFPPGLGVVPVLYDGDFSDFAINLILASLRVNGSQAVPGYMNPEGIVIYHTAGNLLFKVTLEKDVEPKGQVMAAERAGRNDAAAARKQDDRQLELPFEQQPGHVLSHSEWNITEYIKDRYGSQVLDPPAGVGG